MLALPTRIIWLDRAEGFIKIGLHDPAEFIGLRYRVADRVVAEVFATSRTVVVLVLR
jgi:hypothetical protein